MPAPTASFSRKLLLLGGAWFAFAAVGCDFHLPWQRKKPDFPVDSVVMRAQTRPDYDTSPAKLSGALDKAHEQYRLGEYSRAESAFHSIAEDKHNSPLVAEEAR